MKSTLRLSKLLIALVLLITSCQKDDGISNDGNQNENIPDTFSEYFGNEISRDFLGSVIDKDHNPIEGVSISIGSETAVTDSNGVFIIRDATVNERFGYIKAEKAGYIHGSRSVVPSNGTNKVTIMLLEETVVGTVSSGSSDTVTADDGSSVSFDGNFVKEDGTAYTGSVNVIMHHLDPTDQDMEDQMPGMLYAQNEDGAERMLQTLGMLAVELRGSGGEDLNLAEGSTSEIKIPVDATLLASAPATIPLWYFDEATGYWKEEGEATLQGNMYVGTVSHFSFWNCDIPVKAIPICVNVNHENGTAFANLQVTITSESFGTRDGYTNDIGEVCGLVPSDETLILNVFSYGDCGDEPLITENIGPFSTESNISIIIPNNPNFIEESVIGTLNNCDGNVVTDGYVQVTNSDRVFISAVNNGDFELTFYRCINDNTFELSGNNILDLETTGNINYTFTTPITDIGIINACDTILEFVTYTIDDNQPISFFGFDFIVAQLDDDVGFDLESILYLFARQDDNPTNTCLYIRVFNTGSEHIGTYYSIPHQSLGPPETGFVFSSTTWNCLGIPYENNEIALNITTFGEVGEYIDINFSGNYEDELGNPHTINGIIHMLRDQDI